MVFRNSPEFKREKMLETLELIDYNGHVYVNGEFETKLSSLTVYCPLHREENTTKFDYYLRSVTGMPCCGRASKSKLLTNRKFSPETIDKMRTAALERIRLESAGQTWRRSTKYRRWEKEVNNIWPRECALTGEKEGKIVIHHFFSGTRYAKNPSLRNALLYNPLNSIIITKEIHKDFHGIYGYELNTLEQFREYTRKFSTLISSQAEPKRSEGSETKVNALKRVKSLLERLEGIKTSLGKDLPPNLVNLL